MSDPGKESKPQLLGEPAPRRREKESESSRSPLGEPRELARALKTRRRTEIAQSEFLALEL